MKGFLFFLLLLLLLLLLCPNKRVLVQCLTHPDDTRALFDIKASVDPLSVPPASCLASWDFSLDPCHPGSHSFAFSCGFHCQKAPPGGFQRITSLLLDDAGYRGRLPSGLGCLSHLLHLDIGRNEFSGGIPPSLARLRSLHSLDLSGNRLTGAIPPQLGNLSGIVRLSLASNLLSGPIPSSLATLPNLVSLRLNDNRLTSSLPALHRLSQLQLLDASNNLLSGPVPSLLPRSLSHLVLRNNQLTSRIPRSLSSLPYLDVLDLSSNQLSGAVNTLLRSPSLQQLNLAHNWLSAIRVTRGAAARSELVSMDLSSNRLKGELPVYLAFMRRLASLSLDNNGFSGKIPLEYGLKAMGAFIGVEPWGRLFLHGNRLTGSLPSPFVSTLVSHLSATFHDNCLQSCSSHSLFCQGKGEGGNQKTDTQCNKALT